MPKKGRAWCSHSEKNGIGPSTIWASSQDPRVAVALGRKDGHQLGIAVVAVGRVDQRLQETARRVGRARRVEVEAQRAKDLAQACLEAFPVCNGDRARLTGQNVFDTDVAVAVVWVSIDSMD